jgi:hypothetical protein
VWLLLDEDRLEEPVPDGHTMGITAVFAKFLMKAVPIAILGAIFVQQLPVLRGYLRMNRM